ncbi:MAG TPA: hypothetical protein VGR07_02750, partial [Thermoanaerobaculia bacterium]|nr:hypothetical protein [Thermoanaerobaculia bacterium]
MIQIRGRFVLAAALTSATLALGAIGSLAFGASTGSTSLYMPHGSGSPVNEGDFVGSNTPTSPITGLNTFYSYFIEVPASLARLRVQIFDADIGIGGAAEITAQRDRSRALGAFQGTTARYTLIDPTGKARPTRFAIGNNTTPPGADSAWLSFFDGTGSGNGNFVADNF